MKKTFITNFILLMTVNLLVKPFWILGIDRGVQNAVGYEQYGIYTNLFAFSLLFITLLDLGINNYTSTTIARDSNRLREEFAALTGFKLVSALLYILLTLFLGRINNYPPDRLHLLWMLGLNQVLCYFYTYFRSMVGGLQLFRTDALLSVVDRVLMIVLCGSMLCFGVYTISIKAFILAQTIAYLAAVGISLAVIWPYLHQLKLKIEIPHFRGVIKNMLPYALLSLLMTFYTRLDVVLLPKLVQDGDFQVGIYASAYRLLEAANMMAGLVAMLLLPMFSKMIASRENLSPLVQLSTGLLVVPAFGFCLLSFLYQEPITQLLNHHSTVFSAQVFGLVILCFLPLATMYVFGTLLTANGNFKVLNSLALVALILNLVLLFVLVPQYKAYGAAIAAVCTQGFIGITNLVWGIRKLQIRFEPKFARNMLLTLLLLTASMLICSYLQASWWQAAIGLGVVTLLCMAGFRMIDLKQGLELIKIRQSEKTG